MKKIASLNCIHNRKTNTERNITMKKHTIIKIASCALACTMLAGTAAMTVSAAAPSTTSSSASTQKEAAMKTALTAVKKRITIPDELSEFSYSTSQQRSMTKYSFNWRTPSDAKEYKYIEVNIVGNVIFSYNSNINRDEKNDVISFAKLSDSELLSKAKAHLKALNPDIYSKAEISIKRIDIKGNNASFSICHKENGEYVDSDGGNMSIDKNTGELISFNVSWLENASYASTAKAISEKEAQKAFQQLCTLEPRYTISTDWKTGEKSVALVYRPSFGGLIDAFTGKESTYELDRTKDSGSSLPFGSIYANPATGIWDDGVECEEECAEAEDNGVKFTEAELREIQTDESLMTKDAITELLKKDKYIQLPSDFKLDSFNLYKNDKDEYFYNLYYRTNNNSNPVPTPIVYEDGTEEAVIEEPAEEDDYGYFRVNINAKTGEVNSFSKDGVFIAANKNLPDTTPYPVKKNAAIADAAIKHFYPELCEKYKAIESNTAPADYYMDSKQVKHYECYRTYTYNRYENGVLVEGDGINLTMNSAGEVRNISITFTEDLKFPSVPKFDADKAFASLFKQQDIARSYIYYIKKDGTAKTYLVYSTNGFTLDRNYKLCNYNGGEYTVSTSSSDVPKYSDISGIKQEAAIKALARYGITLDSTGGKFNPDGAITDREFIPLLRKVLYNYSYLSIKEEDAVTLTNAGAAKCFVDTINGSDYAELKGIFKSPYSDVPETSKNVGYIAIAKAMGFMDKGNGKFDPSHKLTRAEAMQIIYDYIVNRK